MCNECGDANHVEGLFGGPLTVERINQTLRAFKAAGVETVDIHFVAKPLSLTSEQAIEMIDEYDALGVKRD